MFGKEKKKQALLNDLPGVFRAVCKSKGLPPGDFPDIAKFGNIARELDFAEVNGACAPSLPLSGMKLRPRPPSPRLSSRRSTATASSAASCSSSSSTR